MKKRTFKALVSFMLLISFLIIYFPILEVRANTISINMPSGILIIDVARGEIANRTFSTTPATGNSDQEIRWGILSGQGWIEMADGAIVARPDAATSLGNHTVTIEASLFDISDPDNHVHLDSDQASFVVNVTASGGGTNPGAPLVRINSSSGPGSLSEFPLNPAQVGYSLPNFQNLWVINTTNSQLNGLSAVLNGGSSSPFQVQGFPQNLGGNNNAQFGVRPIAGLPAGTHTDVLRVMGPSGEIGRITLNFTVGGAAGHSLIVTNSSTSTTNISGSTHTFPSVPSSGYSTRPVQRFYIRNMGFQTSNITAVISNGSGYFEVVNHPVSFLGTASGTNYPTTNVTVRPRNSLSARAGNPYTGTLSLRHTNSNVEFASIQLSFEVGGTGTFPTLGQSTIDHGTIRVDSAIVTINITSIGDGISESGVVFSRNSLNTQNLTRPSDAQFSTSPNNTNQAGTRAFTLHDLQPGTRYYVAGFVRDRVTGDYIFEFPATQSFTTLDDSLLPRVVTESAERISNNQIRVELTTQNRSLSAGQRVIERGIVFSRHVSNPTLNNSDGQRTAVTSGPNSTAESSAVITFTPPQANQSYFVRAFARNDNGVAYGVTIQVPGYGTGGAGATWGGYVSTNSPTNMTQTSVTVGGHVTSGINHRVIERGIVYSRTISMPEIHNSNRRVSSVTSSGNFSINLTNMERNARYFARAYIITDDRWNEPFYGNVISFTMGTSGYTTQQTWQAPSQGFVSGVMLEGTAGHRFEPDRAVTRIEVARMIYNMRGRPFAGDGIRFNDMPHDMVDIEALRFVSARGYMLGYEGNMFRPFDPITRAEVVAVASRMYGYTRDHSGTPFVDTQGHWADGYITAAHRNGFIAGFPDRTFRPNANMTRAEAVSMFSRSERRSLAHLGASQFVDVPMNHWAYHFIMSTSIPRP